MDSVHILLIVSSIAGIICIIAAIFKMKNHSQETELNNLEFVNSIKAIDNSIEEAYKAMEDIGTISESALSELENKYQELLFLYNLVDEKKKEVMQMYSNSPVRQVEKTIERKPEKQAVKITNPKHREIMDMFSKGVSIAEISKQLAIGQGEAKLIIELYK